MNEKDFNVIFSKNLNHYMEIRNITQNELAKRVGVSPTSVNNWCNGYKTPRMDKVDKICAFFRISRSDLMTERDFDAQDSSTVLAPDETSLLDKYRQLNEEGRERLLNYADDLVASGRYIKNNEDALVEGA